ncbi:hypothetical protein C2S52_013799 [Perilla frutescens var. hirtella]|nr:hypothetical protein C2S51_016068 [Perilla frutescens var. frutescens]KAH6776238.1 hypothetical protein C2S52_013799 [Perilla frutescens var. hirtella]
MLCIALLNEENKDRSSWWCRYLKQLPQSYGLLESFEKVVQKVKTEWKEATPVLSEHNLKLQFTTFNAWLWASATISSRTMHISWDTAGCLCPVGEFFNYAPPEEGPHQLCESKANSLLRITSCDEGQRAENSTKQPVDAKTDRLADTGYDEALASY